MFHSLLVVGKYAVRLEVSSDVNKAKTLKAKAKAKAIPVGNEARNTVTNGHGWPR